MKRFVAMLLIFSTIVSSALYSTGCASNNNQTSISYGQWLALLNDYFGMESYISDEPYFDNIDESNPYFDTVQIAAEWNIIDGDNIDLEEKITWKQVLLTLVNAGEFSSDDATEEEKIECGIEKFDNSIRTYWLNRYISSEKAIELLSIAQELWANRRYDENIEEYEYRDNVVDLQEDENITVVSQDDNVIVLEGVSTELKEGEICILPHSENKLEKTYVKIEEVTQEDTKTLIVPSSEELQLEDIYEELYIEETLIPTAENTIIYDGNGNIVPIGTNVMTQNSTDSNYKVMNLVTTNNGNDYNIITCASNSHSFTVDGYTVKLGYNLDGELDLSVSIDAPNILNESLAKQGHSIKFNAGVEISDLEVTQKVDWKTEWKGIVPIPTLDTAEFKVDYTVKQKYGIAYSGKEEFLAAPAYSNGNGKFLTNFKRAIMKKDNGDVYGAETIASKKTIKICSLNIYSAGVAKVCLDVVASISVNGSIEVTITENGSKGVEYKNGNLRFIKTNNKSVDAQAKAKVEATLGFGPALYVIGLEKRLVGLEIKIGLGTSISLKAHLADSQMHLIEEADFSDTTPEQASAMMAIGNEITADAIDIQAVAEAQGGIFKAQVGEEIKLHIDWCLDVKGYGILSVGVSDESYLVDFLNTKKITLTVSILNEKNATFFNMHIDNFDWSDAQFNWGSNATKNNCTLNYIPFDQDSSEEATDTEATDTEIRETEAVEKNSEIMFGEILVLSTMNVNLEVGQKCSVSVTTLPENYGIEDIVFSSGNNDVATINEKGVIEAVGDGCTVVCAKTKDGKYSAIIAVIVKNSSEVEFEGLWI